MLFDIHTERAAQETLFRLTGIPIEVWEENIDRERDYELQDYFVEAMIEEREALSLSAFVSVSII